MLRKNQIKIIITIKYYLWLCKTVEFGHFQHTLKYVNEEVELLRHSRKERTGTTQRVLNHEIELDHENYKAEQKDEYQIGIKKRFHCAKVGQKGGVVYDVPCTNQCVGGVSRLWWHDGWDNDDQLSNQSGVWWTSTNYYGPWWKMKAEIVSCKQAYSGYYDIGDDFQSWSCSDPKDCEHWFPQGKALRDVEILKQKCKPSDVSVIRSHLR